jgi:3-dehydroquinate dehydratase type I
MRTDICLSIGNVDYDAVIEHLNRVSFAEIRIDLLKLSHEQLNHIFSTHKNLIATCREGSISDEERSKILINALEQGAAFVDVEIESAEHWRKPIVEKAKALGRKVIVSSHSFDCTPDVDNLYRMVDSLFSAGADIAKIACMVRSPEDNAKMLGLYANFQNLISFGLGNRGIISRVLAPLMGAPFTYASIPGMETAEGQLDKNQMNEIINFLERHTSGKD